MVKTAYVKSRLDPDLKQGAENIIKAMGLTPSALIQLLYQQIINRKKIPFEIGYEPNEETIKAIKESENYDKLESFNSVDALMKDLND